MNDVKHPFSLHIGYAAGLVNMTVNDTRKIWLWFGAAAVLIALMMMLALQVARQGERTDALRERTYRILDTANAFMSGMKDSEASARGYLLLGRESYLAPYQLSQDTLALNLADLLNFTQDDPVQQQRLQLISQLADNKLIIMERVITLRRNQDVAGAMNLFRTEQGKQLMDGIRTSMEQFVDLEKNLLAQRNADFRVHIGRLLMAVTLLGAFAVMTAATAAYTVYRETRRRLAIQEQTKTQLEEQNARLKIAADKLIEEEAQLLAQHQETLKARERMILIEKMSSMGTMVGGVAHEINNPLMGVMNYVEYARDKTVDAKSLEVLNSALHEINRIKKIVQNMLVFVRADGEQQESCSIHDSVRQTAALLEGEFKKNEVQLQVELPDDLPQIKCGSGSLQQVLVNLLLNARDAIAGQAEQRVAIKARCQDEKVVLSVCDSGPGVSDEIRRHIFDPFFTTKPVGKGTGLGLSVSRQLIENAGGSLNLYDEPGYGSCFKVILDAV